MKNITTQYRDLQEGKMTKANFMANVRMQFPDYISPVNSYEDMVNILKSKRILSETHEQKTFYLVDHGKVVDSVKATDKTAAENHFYNEFEGEMTGWMVTDVHPDSLDETSETSIYEDEDSELAAAKEKARKDSEEGYVQHVNKTRWGYSVEDWYDSDNTVASYENGEQINENAKDIEALQAGALKEGDKDAYKMGLDANRDGVHYTDCPYAKDSLEGELWIDGWMDYETAKQMEHDEETYNRETGGYGDRYNDKDKDDWSKMDKDDVHPAGWPGMTERLNEVAEKSEGSYKKVTGKDLYSFFNEIDRVNPYEVRKGIAIEMGMQYEATPNYFTDKFNPESLAKATRKVLKNLQKDPAYYTNMISLPTEKRTNMLQKPKEMKVKADGATKIKGFTDAKANTETSLVKKERAKGSPEGVKEMKPSKKSMGGLKTMKSNDKLPKGVELMKEADLTNSPAGLNTLKTSDLAAAGKAIHDLVGKTFTVSSLPADKIKGYEDLKVGDKLKITKHWRNANNAVLFGTDESEYGLTQQDIKSLTMPDQASRLKELVMQEVKRRMSEGGLYALKNPANPAAKGLPSVVSPDPSTETSTAFKNMYIKKAQ